MNRTLLYLSLFYFLSPISLFSDMFPFQTIEKANKAYIDGKFRTSARLFNTLDRKDAFVAYNRANAYYKAGMYDASERSYIRAKGVDEATRTYNLGNVYFKKREFDKAIDSYEHSLTVREDSDTRFNLELAKQKREENKSREQVKKRKPLYLKLKESKKRDKEITNEEKIRKQELTHLLKQVSKKRMPSMLYLIESEKEEQNDKNPW